MNAAHVDRQLDGRARTDRDVPVDARGEERPLVVDEERAFVVRQVLNRRLHRLRDDPRGVDREDHVHLGAEIFDHLGPHDQAWKRRIRRLAVREVRGTDPDDQAAGGHVLSGRERELVAREAHGAVGDVGFDEIHGRRADERRDEQVRGTPEQGLRRVHLLQDAVTQNGDTLAERHRLDLVVRDVDRRHAETVVETRELAAHRDAQLGIEVRERFVHEERLRLAHHRAAHRNALALAARELAGLAARGAPRARALPRHPRPAARAPPSRSCAA